MNVLRPDWMTDAEVDELARRTHAALCEAGQLSTLTPADDPRLAWEFGRNDRGVFEKARQLAARSLGWDIVDDKLVRS